MMKILLLVATCLLAAESRRLLTRGKGTGVWGGMKYAKRSAECVDTHTEINCADEIDQCETGSNYFADMFEHCKMTCGFCSTRDEPAFGRLQSDFAAGGCEHAKEGLEKHNQLRAKHGAPALKWDDGLAKEAQEWAQENANAGMMHHSTEEQRNMEGENLAYLWVGIPEMAATAVKDGVQMWEDEEPLYNPDDPSPALHFTQMVWKATKKIGIGCAKSGDMEYITARYAPRGNFDSFTDNVQM